MIKFPSIGIFLSFILGILLRSLNFKLEYIFVVCIIGIILSFFFLRRNYLVLFDISILVNFLLAGLVCVKVSDFVPRCSVKNIVCEYKEIIVEGFVCSDPVKLKKGTKIIFSPFRAKYKDICYTHLCGKIKAFLPSSNLEYGDYISFKLRKFKSFFKGKNVYKIKSCILNPFKYFAFRIRNKIKDLFFSYFPYRHAGFLASIILGKREYIDFQDYLAFKRTGTLHILAISGLHTGVFVGILNFVLKFLGVRRKWRLLCLLGVLPFWIVFTGASIPTLRASLFTFFWVLTFLLQRKSSLVNNIFLSAFLLLLARPQELFNPSFQLSYLCVISLACVYRLFSLSTAKKFIKILLNSILSSFAIWIVIWPLVSFYFGIVSLGSIVANVLIVGIIWIVIISVFLFITIPFLREMLRYTIWVFLEITFKINHFFASLKFTWINYKIHLEGVIVYYVIIGSVFLFYKIMKSHYRITHTIDVKS